MLSSVIKPINIFRNLRKLRRSEKWDYKKLKKLQEKKLRSIIHHAYDNIPFYREKFKSVGISPSDIKTIEDLQKIPITEKQEVRKAYPSEIVWDEVSLEEAWITKTGGSTGIPLSVVYDNKAEAFQKAVHLRANFSVGQSIWDRWAVITSEGHMLDKTFFQRLGILPVSYISVHNEIEDQIYQLNKFSPQVLDGYASSIWLIANEKLKNPESVKFEPKLIYTTAELLDPAMREDIEKAFPNSLLIDQFGCVEMDRTAWECEEHEGYHIDMESVVMEFLNDGEQVWNDEEGEIVYTNLYNYSMPLIRYRSRDIGVPAFDQEPKCHRGLPLMKLVKGRKDDFIVTKDGRMFSPRTISVLMKELNFRKNMKEYKFIQKDYDRFELILALEDSHISRNEIITELKNELRQSLSLKGDFTLKLKITDKIKRKNKLRKVVSKMDVDFRRA